MNCRGARERLSAAGPGAGGLDTGRPIAAASPPAPGALSEHLNGCPACSAYAARLDLARQLLGEHHAGVEPDAGFAARVVAALPGTPGLVSRAALKLLPAALALVLVLAGWCLIDTHGPADLLEQARTSGEKAPTDEPLSWALESNGEAS